MTVISAMAAVSQSVGFGVTGSISYIREFAVEWGRGEMELIVGNNSTVYSCEDVVES